MIFFLSVFPALAPEKPLLTKRREPKPTNSACAEFVGFVPLQKKTQCLRQNLIAKAANFPVIKEKGYYNADFFTVHKSKQRTNNCALFTQLCWAE